ncbi:MAG: hypothetical protein QGG40_22640, partial [Myxococcota bacterium]|nr:hypothetical protein [Myxococcota bacterium]
GTGTWGDLETDGDTIYVDASAEDGGDGSKDSPFTVIQEGLDAQGKNGMVAVAAGTYVENLQINSDHTGVHLAGRCRELVVVDGSEGDEEDYTEGCGIYLYGPGITDSWTVSGVTTSWAPWVGILQYRGTLSLDRVESSENEVRGINTEYGTLVANDCIVQGNHEIGVFVCDSSASLQDVQVLDTRRCTVSTTAMGVVSQAGSTVSATDLTVRDTVGPALYVATAALLSCTDCTLTDNAFAGAVAQNGGELVLENSLIEGTTSSADTGAGLGVFVDDVTPDDLGPPTLTIHDSTIR